MCADCNDCGGSPPRPIDEPDFDVGENDAEDLYQEIADIAAWESVGIQTDWSQYPQEYRRLYRIWKQTERDVDNMRAARFSTYIKSHFKK